ncbi:MAG TPA: DUF4259 domain-containing protein [Terriglobales bacterium]|nr:DUF4259 domain-containing protein [Terriglobales bacterium]
MPGWGPGSFENDDAQAWLATLASLAVGDLRVPLVRAADKEDYLETPESSVAIAAAEAVAALKQVPADVLPKEVAEWVRRVTPQKTDASIPELTALAARAVQRVRTNSELKDLWLEADGLNEWSANLRDLEARLAEERLAG